MKRKGLLILMAITLGMVACKKKGCTDETAVNYDATAEEDDGSCSFAQNTTTATLDCNSFTEENTEYELVDLGLEIDYVIDCKMAINGDLKIKNGVTIAFTTGAGLKVNASGSLNAVATGGAPIVFTGVDDVPGSWAGLYIDSEDIKNNITGCLIEYAGGDAFNSNDDHGAIILYASSSAEVSENIIQHSASYGINANYGDGDFVIADNAITSCTFPIFTTAETAGSITGGSYVGNETDAIYVDSYASDGTIITAQTWTFLGVPYRIRGGGELISNTNWIIEPGVTVEFEASVSVKISDGNSLRAVGTAQDLITFRGVNPGPGAWKNIKFWGTNNLNEIGFAEISGGGEDASNTQGTISLWYDAALNIHDVNFTDNAACGVYGVIFSGTSANPNYASSNLTFTNTPCTESFED